MSLLNENVVTLAKVEATYGTDATPTGADALVTSQVKMTPLEQTTVARNLDKPNSGADQELNVENHVMIEFSVELVGSGTLGTAPAYGKLLRACRCLETITALTSVVYTPYPQSTTSLTLYFFLDGNRHKLLGARGTFTIEANSQGIPIAKFKFWGLYVPPTRTANPGGLTGWDDFQIPVAINYDNTPPLEVHGYTSTFTRFTFDAGNDVKVFNNPGENEVRITAHKATGKLSFLAPAIDDLNVFEIARNSTLGAMKLEHGTSDGTRWFFESAASSCQLLKPNYGDDNGRATIETDVLFVPGAAGNEWQLRFAAA